jgi:hypothetical protein
MAKMEFACPHCNITLGAMDPGALEGTGDVTCPGCGQGIPRDAIGAAQAPATRGKAAASTSIASIRRRLSAVRGGGVLFAGFILLLISLGIKLAAFCLSVGFPLSLPIILLAVLLERLLRQIATKGASQGVAIIALLVAALIIGDRTVALTGASWARMLGDDAWVRWILRIDVALAVVTSACFILGFRAASAIDNGTVADVGPVLHPDDSREAA